ncbi:hypothetical protein AYO38_09405 [bacterium SCGC AG-212-C10]|nr:hypothetical protein AYO38_09405 [bacterium SCGC AG-212-C10]
MLRALQGARARTGVIPAPVDGRPAYACIGIVPCDARGVIPHAYVPRHDSLASLPRAIQDGRERAPHLAAGGTRMQTGAFRGFEVAIEDPGIAVVTFNQPERLNGLNQWIKRDLVETFLQIQMDDSIRLVVITGQGRAFCAGDDITGRPDGGGEPLMADIPGGHRNAIGTYEGLRGLSQPLTMAVRNLDKLCIAAMNGIAIQSGFSLALACDFRIASREARMGSATMRFALLPDEGGQYLLVQHMGVAKTMDFLMRKRIVGADEALELGLVHEVVEPDQCLPRAMALARELADGPNVAQRLLKRSIYNAAEMTFAHALDEIAAKTSITDHHPDAKEGTAAWRDKRPPRFNAWMGKPDSTTAEEA